MRADAKSAEALTRLHVKVEEGLSQRLRALVRLERARSFREVVIYLLEAWLAVVQKQTRLRLRPRAQTDAVLSGHVEGQFPTVLYHRLVVEAHRFGMRYTDLCRLGLWQGVEVQEELARKGEVVTKEVFIELMKRKFE